MKSVLKRETEKDRRKQRRCCWLFLWNEGLYTRKLFISYSFSRIRLCAWMYLHNCICIMYFYTYIHDSSIAIFSPDSCCSTTGAIVNICIIIMVLYGMCGVFKLQCCSLPLEYYRIWQWMSVGLTKNKEYIYYILPKMIRCNIQCMYFVYSPLWSFVGIIIIYPPKATES